MSKPPFKLRMTSKVALRLETAVSASGRLEFSGLGFVKEEKGGLVIYDAVVLHVGSEGYTEIDPEKIFPLLDREDAANIKCWFHRHPIGNGKPGRDQWSGLDEHTIQTAPLGGIPELVKWSVSIVRTPGGWVGRVDNHLKRTTVHVPVYPLLPENFIGEIWEMRNEAKPDLVAVPLEKGTDTPQKKQEAVPLGQHLGTATTKVTGTPMTLTQQKKSTIKLPTGAFEYGEITVKEFLGAIAELQALEDIMDFTLVWADQDGYAYPVRFDPMTGRVRNGKFVLDEPAKVLCVN